MGTQSTYRSYRAYGRLGAVAGFPKAVAWSGGRSCDSLSRKFVASCTPPRPCEYSEYRRVRVSTQSTAASVRVSTQSTTAGAPAAPLCAHLEHPCVRVRAEPHAERTRRQPHAQTNERATNASRGRVRCCCAARARPLCEACKPAPGQCQCTCRASAGPVLPRTWTGVSQITFFSTAEPAWGALGAHTGYSEY